MVAGLEIHARINTKSKMFCACSNDTFGKEPNTHICPVCLGFPGALPTLNEEALSLGLLTGLALQCRWPSFSRFDRKSYFYPDLPSGFQISQFDAPIVQQGLVFFWLKGEKRSIRIHRLHLENDAGKLIHEKGKSLVDYNRSGSPLMEIVTEADFRSPEEIVAFLKELQKILRTIGSSDADMEKGMMRCDVNISLRPKGQEAFGTKTELKNINSFGNIEKAVRAERERQQRLLESGESIISETRGWDADRGVSVSQRTKEEAADYRYFPEPDLPPLFFSPEQETALRSQLPELPAAKQERYQSDYGLPPETAEIIAGEKVLSTFFEKAASIASPQKVAYWITGEMLALLNGAHPNTLVLLPESLGALVALIDSGHISGKIAKEIFPEVFLGKDPKILIAEKGLTQNSNSAEIGVFVDQVLEENPQSVEDYLQGKEKALGALVGALMKKSGGKANPQIANTLLREKLQDRKSL